MKRHNDEPNARHLVLDRVDIGAHCIPMYATKTKAVALLKPFETSLLELQIQLLYLRQVPVCLVHQPLAVHLGELRVDYHPLISLAADPALDVGIHARSSSKSRLLHVQVLRERHSS